MDRFSSTCNEIAQTTKKLLKEQTLSSYFRSLNDRDLAIASIFLSGRPFPLKDQRTTNTGFAVVRDAVFELFPGSVDRLPTLLVRMGDFGDALEVLFQDRIIDPSLELSDVMSYYENLTTSVTSKEKRRLTREVLERATGKEAKYIVKILLGGMRIGLQESLVESSLAKAFQQPLKQVQNANMLLGDIGECAILARHGRLADARMKLMHPIKLMLASPEEDILKILEYMDGKGLAEDKYDGIRAQIHKDQDTIKIFSRDLDDVTRSFPDIVAAVGSIPVSCILDGEILPFRDGKILSFGELQTRLGRKDLSPTILESVPCRYFAFDLIYIEDHLLINEPLRERRACLVDLKIRSNHAFEIARQTGVATQEEVEAAFTSARSENNEGLVLKHPESTYTPGKRGKSWLKLKRALITLDVVVVAAEYGHGKRAGLLSDYTFAVQHNGELFTIGKAYSGITDVELKELSDLFHKISTRNDGYTHVVPPKVVFEVLFDRIHRSDRHTSGFALRFPRIKRIRWDKKPHEIDDLETVEKLFQQQT